MQRLPMGCVLLALAFAALQSQSARAQFCGGCFSGPPPTLSQQLERADSVVRAKWVRRNEATRHLEETTSFEIVEVCRDQTGLYAPKNRLALPGDWEGAPGDEFVLLHRVGDPAEQWELNQWSKPVCRYALNAPSPQQCAARRLVYFLPFLEHPDPEIASDAYQELEQADHEDLIAIRKALPVKQLRSWIVTADEYRRGGYATLLGLCGTRADGERLARLAFDRLRRISDEDYAPGPWQEIAASLRLSGTEGLAQFEALLRKPEASWTARSAVHIAVDTLLESTRNSLQRNDLLRIIRSGLEDSDLSAASIGRLTSAKDWTVLPRVSWLFLDSDSEDVQSAAIHYMQICERHSAAHPEIAETARGYLQLFQKTRPTLFERKAAF